MCKTGKLINKMIQNCRRSVFVHISQWLELHKLLCPVVQIPFPLFRWRRSNWRTRTLWKWIWTSPWRTSEPSCPSTPSAHASASPERSLWRAISLTPRSRSGWRKGNPCPSTSSTTRFTTRDPQRPRRATRAAPSDPRRLDAWIATWINSKWVLCPSISAIPLHMVCVEPNQSFPFELLTTHGIITPKLT